MNGDGFIDTNVLIYLLDDNLQKKHKALAVCRNRNIISINVINEYTNVCRKKLNRPVPFIKKDVEFLLARLNIVFPEMKTFFHSLKIGLKYGYSHFDSLMLATALDTGCSVFYSEDMQHNQMIEGRLKIINPFLS
ncbi:MAG: PIN domain-containing protein [Spirochaetia bacterium]|jgi:predicted nucleic acid-binding protein|nr:PIN domain-containing protein [Spirochaetia bacterium]